MKNSIIEQIKKYLVESEDYDSYIDFVDNQVMGDCQTIVSDIHRKFPEVIKCFGEVEVDEEYYDEDMISQKFMTHHWIEIDNEIYDFSKGTLKNYINFDSIYDPEISINELDKYS